MKDVPLSADLMQNRKESVSPASLLADNQSPLARHKRKKWNSAREQRILIGCRGCCDAREQVPGSVGTVQMRTIAASGFTKESGTIFEDPSIACVVSLGHFDGETKTPGQPLKGCGGLLAIDDINILAKEVSLTNSPLPEDAPDNNLLVNHLKENLSTSDVVLQTLLAALIDADQTKKPTLAAIQDHRTLEVYPIAVIHKGVVVANPIVMDFLTRDLPYDLNTFYANGIPTLDRKDIPDIFTGFLKEADMEAAFAQRENPNLNEEQKIQNPRTIILSSLTRPQEVCFPNTFGKIGSAFKVNIPRTSIDDSRVSDVDLELAVIQVQYPADKSLESNNSGNLNGPFKDTDTFLIETDNLALSRRLAVASLDLPSMKDWLSLPGRKILIAEIKNGEAKRIEEFNPSNPVSRRKR